METLERWLLGISRLIIGTLILISIAINLANTIGRYVFDAPIYWAEEVMIFMMVWCVFVGAVLVTWDGTHLKMDLFANMLSMKARRIVNALAALLLMAISAIIAFQSWQVTSRMAELGQKSMVAEVPMVFTHSALLVGFIIMFLVVLVRFRTLMIPTDLNAEIEEALAEQGKASRD
jgi:TRAP-type C4-dicarboxylate transport system permease small subunit